MAIFSQSSRWSDVISHHAVRAFISYQEWRFSKSASSIAGKYQDGPAKVSSSQAHSSGCQRELRSECCCRWRDYDPLMKTGFKPEFAAAVETTASTGPMCRPWWAGLSSWLNFKFHEDLVIAAIIPAMLPRPCVGRSCRQEGLRGLERDQFRY
jgi:hypothetical protein